MITYDTYDEPKSVLDDGSLTHEQKCTVLKQWAYDVYRLMESTDEGMEPKGKEGDPCLNDVLEALRTIAPAQTHLSESWNFNDKPTV